MIVPSQLQVLAAQSVAPVSPAPRVPRRRRRAGDSTDLAIRVAGRRDACAIRALELLDDHPLSDGPRLLAELGGVPVAAIAVADESIVADPFERTAGVIDLLRIRARQLRGAETLRRTPRLALLERLAR
jgi:hypothetical protein